MKFEGLNNKNEKPATSRREFLKKAGKFISGGMLAASMGEDLYKAGKQVPKNPESAGAFNVDLLLKELNDLQLKYGLDWKEETRKKFNTAVTRVVEAIKEKNKEDQKIKAGVFGFLVGTIPPFFKLRDLFNKAEFSQEEFIKVANTFGLSGGVGSILFQIFSHGSLIQNEGNLSQEAVAMALQLLPELKDKSSSKENMLKETILLNTASFSSFFSKELNLKSQLEQWAAGSAVTLLAIAEEAKKLRKQKS